MTDPTLPPEGIASGWQPIETAPKDGTVVLVAMIRDDKIQRVSDAVFNGLGWYTKNGGVACHWRTHWAFSNHTVEGDVSAAPSGMPEWMARMRPDDAK